MSTTSYYSDIKVIKKPLKQRIKGVLKFIVFSFVVLGCFLGARYFSNALTVGNLGAFIVYGDTKLKLDKITYYAVTMGEYVEKSEAEKVALGTTIQGASGYIWEKQQKYYVIGNVYSNISDAEKVVQNLSNTKYNVDILEIVCPKVSLDYSMYDNEDMDIINNAFNVFDDAYEKLYDFSIRFDQKDINHLAISSSLSEFRGEVKTLIINIQKLIDKSNSNITKVQNSLIKLDELIDQTIIKTIDNSATSYSLKYAIASVVRMKYELINSF